VAPHGPRAVHGIDARARRGFRSCGRHLGARARTRAADHADPDTGSRRSRSGARARRPSGLRPRAGALVCAFHGSRDAQQLRTRDASHDLAAGGKRCRRRSRRRRGGNVRVARAGPRTTGRLGCAGRTARDPPRGAAGDVRLSSRVRRGNPDDQRGRLARRRLQRAPASRSPSSIPASRTSWPSRTRASCPAPSRPAASAPTDLTLVARTARPSRRSCTR